MPVNEFIQTIQHNQRKNNHRCRDHRSLDKPDSDRNARAGTSPQTRSGRKTAHLLLSGDDDRAYPQKAHAADHLRANPVDIPLTRERDAHIFTCHRRKRRTHTDQNMRLDPGTPIFKLPVQTNENPDDGRNGEPQRDRRPSPSLCNPDNLSQKRHTNTPAAIFAATNFSLPTPLTQAKSESWILPCLSAYIPHAQAFLHIDDEAPVRLPPFPGATAPASCS